MLKRLKEIFRGLFPVKEKKVSWSELLARSSLCPGDIAIDCGANVGNVTAKMAESGARIYAFEPNPYAYRVLEERFQESPNVDCINKGVLDCNDTMRLFLHENVKEDQVYWSTGSSLLDFKSNIETDTFVEIEVIDLAQFIASLKSEVKLVKMDIEGVEYRVIHHLIDTGMIEKIGLLLVESHEERIPELREAANKLRDRITRERLSNINLSWI